MQQGRRTDAQRPDRPRPRRRPRRRRTPAARRADAASHGDEDAGRGGREEDTRVERGRAQRVGARVSRQGAAHTERHGEGGGGEQPAVHAVLRAALPPARRPGPTAQTRRAPRGRGSRWRSGGASLPTRARGRSRSSGAQVSRIAPAAAHQPAGAVPRRGRQDGPRHDARRRRARARRGRAATAAPRASRRGPGRTDADEQARGQDERPAGLREMRDEQHESEQLDDQRPHGRPGSDGGGCGGRRVTEGRGQERVDPRGQQHDGRRARASDEEVRCRRPPRGPGPRRSARPAASERDGARARCPSGRRNEKATAASSTVRRT